MADDLEVAIEHAQKEWLTAKTQADHWVRKVEILATRLNALQDAAKMRPALSARIKSQDTPPAKGRQPGSISQTWRNVLKVMRHNAPDGAEEIDIAEMAKMVGLINIRPKDVRDRMNNYEQHGYVEQAINGWRVTEYAMSKFGTNLTDDEIGDEE